MTAEQVQAALDAALNTEVELNPKDPYQRVLSEFVDNLNKQTWLRAEVRPVAEGKAPGALRLVIWPRYQRSLATTLHSLLLQGGSARVVRDDGAVLTSPESFDQYLLDSLQSPRAAETLREFRRISSEDAEGYLRVKALRALTVNDVSVIVPHAEQVKLADAAEAGGAELEVLVELLHPAPLGKYQTDADYRFLNAGGYAMIIGKKTETVRERIVKVTGTVMSAKDTPYSEE
jgi:hypothetical protein